MRASTAAQAPGYARTNDSSMSHMAACAAASAAVLGLIRREEGLLGALGALRHYFLLARGDLFTSLLDSAREELGQRADELSVPRMQGLLELGALPCARSWLHLLMGLP